MTAEENIRPLHLSDLGVLMEVERRCYPSPWSEKQFADEFENPVSTVFGFREAERLAGYLCLWLIAGEVQILNVAVDPDFRRRGIGAALLAFALAHCVDRGAVSAWLEVRAGNSAAIELYHNHGFVIDGKRRRYYRDGEDALLMSKTL